MMADAPFWPDDFNMDLPKVFPDARRLLGDLADVELVPVGHPDKNGRLNHPCVWNSDEGSIAFFGFGNSCRNESFYVAPGAQDIKCTAWEAFRDAWAHNFLMIVDAQRVWNAGDLWPYFETIMYEKRGWPLGDKSPRLARLKAMGSYAGAVRAFGCIVNNRRANSRIPSPTESAKP